MVIHRIQKSGNSFYVTIPKEYFLNLGLKPKDYVMVGLEGDKIIIRPLAGVPAVPKKRRK